MSAVFRLDTKGGREIELRLGALVAGFGDLTPLMQQIGTYGEGAVLERFETETAPDGSAWEKSKRAIAEGGKTLTDSSQLRSSRTSNASSDSVEIGTNKIYAGVHNFGFDGTVTVASHSRTIFEAFGLRLAEPVTFKVDAFERSMNMPKRTFLGFSAEDEVGVLALTEDYAIELGGAGFA